MRFVLAIFVLLLAFGPASADAQRGSAQEGSEAEHQARAHFEAGRRLVEAESFLAARTEFQRGFEYSLRPLFLFNMAECARELGDSGAARREYSEYLRIEPDGDFSRLATRRLRALGPGDTRTPEFVTGARTQQRARVHVGQGTEAFQATRYAEALSEFQQAYRLTEDPSLLFHIAMAHQRLEHRDQALQHFERFLGEALPGAPDRAMAESQRDRLRAQQASSGDGDAGESSAFGLRGGAIVSLGVSGVGLLSMLVSGALTLSKRAELDEQECASAGCETAQVDSLARRARTFDVSAALSLAAFATGLTLLLISRDETTAGVYVAPSLALGSRGLDQAGLSLQGEF